MLAHSVPNSSIVAAIQFQPTLLDVYKNMSIAQQLTYEAATKGARLIVLPELCMSGYVLRSPYEAKEVAQDCKGYQTQALYEVSKRFGCYIVFGYVELCDGKLYNSAAVIGPNGLEGNFHKKNLHGSDYFWANSSDQFPRTVITPAGRTGVLICKDAINTYREGHVLHKQNHKFYNKGDVDTIALLTNWGEKYGYPDSSWVDLSESTSANVIVSNRVGKERDMTYKGGCCIIDKNKKIHTYGSNFTHEAIVGGITVI